MIEGISRSALRRAVAPGLAALMMLAVPGCVRETGYGGVNDAVYYQKQGPPPWAPAHGYRHKHPGGALLIYDAGLGSYLVGGHPGCYFHSGRFYCSRGKAWKAGPDLGGPWTVVSLSQLPPGIAKKWGAANAPGQYDGKHGGKHGHAHGHKKF